MIRTKDGSGLRPQGKSQGATGRNRVVEAKKGCEALISLTAPSPWGKGPLEQLQALFITLSPSPALANTEIFLTDKYLMTGEILGVLSSLGSHMGQ